MDLREHLTSEVNRLAEEARNIATKAKTSGRTMTDGERADVKARIELVAKYKADLADEDAVELASQLKGVESGLRGGGSVFAAFKAAGWSPGVRTTIPAQVAVKTASFDGDPNDISPVRVEGASLGFDRRWLYSVFPATPVDAGVTSVDVLEQSARTLANPSDVIRTVLETTPKPETETVRTLVAMAMNQLASVETGIPNGLLLAPQFRSTVDVDLRLAYESAMDVMVKTAIDASTPVVTANGVDLTEAIVYAAAEMAEDGYNGTVVALSPMDAATLALLRGADEQFARSDPLAGFRLVAAKGIDDGDALLIDPSAAGRLYVGPVSLQSFEENAGSTNSSTVRYEGNAAFAVDRVEAIRAITQTS